MSASYSYEEQVAEREAALAAIFRDLAAGASHVSLPSTAAYLRRALVEGEGPVHGMNRMDMRRFSDFLAQPEKVASICAYFSGASENAVDLPEFQVRCVRSYARAARGRSTPLSRHSTHTREHPHTPSSLAHTHVSRSPLPPPVARARGRPSRSTRSSRLSRTVRHRRRRRFRSQRSIPTLRCPHSLAAPAHAPLRRATQRHSQAGCSTPH